jgi:hypothetical protein
VFVGLKVVLVLLIEHFPYADESGEAHEDGWCRSHRRKRKHAKV